SNPLPTSCELTSQCRIGTCVINDGESCSANVGKEECEVGGGVWDEKPFNEVPECEKGACVLGDEVKFITEKQCELESASLGLALDFRQGVTELNFEEVQESLEKGACLIGDGNCRFVTASECQSANGEDFIPGWLCTNPELETSCVSTENTMCSDGKVYFTDSCGNLGNVYDSNKVDAEKNPEYWNEKINSNEVCQLDLDNSNSIKSCGNCNVFLSSQCSQTENNNQVNYGNYFCKDLRCIDNNGDLRLNGERWCEYDSYVGEGKDAVGGEHWLVSCTNGDIETNSCGSYRGGICEQSIIEDEQADLTFSTASCIPNLAFQCIDYNRNEDTQAINCNENSQCQLKVVDVDDNFQFDFCSPQYPRGFNLKGSQEDNRLVCSLANTQCIVTYEKKISGWKCIDNCDCEDREFGEKMNDLCISLGDCGSYINYIGKGTNNVEIVNSENIDWSSYTQYKDNPEGRYIESADISEYGQFLGITSVNGEYDQEDIDTLTAGLGVSGSLFLLRYLNSEKTSGGSGISTGASAVSWLDKIFGSSGGSGGTAAGCAFGTCYNAAGEIVSSPATATNTIFGAAKPFVNGALGAVAGYFAGQLIADFFGIQGTYATVLSIATATIGAVVGYYGISNLGAIQGAALGAVAVAVVVIVVIIALGLGKTKTVEVNFSCLPWQSPTGGNDCSLCGSDGKPCTQYRCESLGQACQLINANTENAVCESLPYEPNPPILTLGDVGNVGNLTNYTYQFQNEETNSVDIRQTNGECVPEFAPVQFSLKTNEYAQCKWSFNPTATYESMSNYGLEGTTYSLEHNFVFTGLSLSLLEAEEISGNLIDGFLGNTNIYIKCQDYFGNFNINDYVVNFCVQSGPDITPVLHSATVMGPGNGSILKYGTTETNFTMWTIEPAECRYDTTAEKDFSEMSGLMSCKTNLTDRRLYGWPCEGNLTNLQENNTYYIKCSDQPWLAENNPDNKTRNINSEDFVYTLYVNQNALDINSAYVEYFGATTAIPLDSQNPVEIRGGGNVFNVEIGIQTVNGSEDGIAECSYTWANSVVPFFETNARTHKQDLVLNSGNYTLPITCTDLSGDSVTKNMVFNLNIDNDEPFVIRAYHEASRLRITTDEQAKCYVSFDNERRCNFDTANASIMSTVGSDIFNTEHSISWIDGETYYIKCEDVWGNRNVGCGIVVTPSLA
ncbi:MAG: hypothetical protein HY361_00670, partial [Candidatus Aenigmarchaeota archaeon]|nr:hypothetical protein [Candidatus Aenigmarchaeota archaeon]